MNGHALALTLAGRYLAQHKKGDIRAIRELPDLPQLAPARSARPTASCAPSRSRSPTASPGRTQVEEPAADPAGRQLALLFFLGLFDRPAERALLPVVFSEAAAGLGPATPMPRRRKSIPFPSSAACTPSTRSSTAAVTPEWRKQQIEQLKQPLAATHSAVIEARRRALVRGLFAGMHAVIGDEAKITDALVQLADQGLVSLSPDHAGIDCHPLVRGYFGMRLKELDAEIFRAAHGRLYDHYRYAGLPAAFRDPVAYGVAAIKAAYEGDRFAYIKQHLLAAGHAASGARTASPFNCFARPWAVENAAFALIGGPEWQAAKAAFLPDDEAGTTPLFAAVAHGCAAETGGSRLSAKSIRRASQGVIRHSQRRKLGLSGQDLAALASFFEKPFTTPSARLAEAAKRPVLKLAGFGLRALGRVAEAAALLARFLGGLRPAK